MRIFDFRQDRLLTGDIVALLTKAHEYKGKQDLALQAHADELASLLNIARIQSTAASNRLEGIHTTDERVRALMLENSVPQNRPEEEIAGYRRVLNLIHENHDHIRIKPGFILQLHRDLYSYTSFGSAGRWKDADNAIVETDGQGNQRLRFQPVPAFETPESMDRLCSAYREAIRDEKADRLLTIFRFILDFLCIHPFNDGNGRMSRLLTLLALYQNGFLVGKYISLEGLTEKTKETYYDALKASSREWHTGNNTYEPFVRYMLGILVSAYRDFSQRIEYIRDTSLSKPERIRRILSERAEPVSRQELADLCPDIGIATIKNTLALLVREGFLTKIGSARATKYVWKQR